MRKLYVDMDGTIANFHENKAYLMEMNKPNFFVNLKPIKPVIDALEILNNNGVDIYILSACIDTPYCECEKKEWLKRNVPFLSEQKYIFVKTGENKAEKIGDELKNNPVLLDDYTHNLEEWERAGGLGLKLINGINGLNGKWKEERISYDCDCVIIAEKIFKKITCNSMD